MFFVFGTDARQKEVKRLDKFLCKRCNEESSASVIRAYKCFHLFFIPIIKYRSMYYIQCEDCGAVHELSDEKAKAIVSGGKDSITIWDVDLLTKDAKGKNNSLCNECNGAINESYNYCPHCGKKL